ncbi:MAG TPA: sialidase family protein [Candidatus Hydrogenedens sp.]|nr:glycoside hydrolase [Candidatus Hydrogenedens sp.]HPP58034.1 sialidase family protein [Candidatus Hydrogenedens sp.]
MRQKMILLISFLVLYFLVMPKPFAEDTDLSFKIETQCAFNYDGDDFCWFHPRLATIPIITNNGYPLILMTLQKHLIVSDYYSGMYTSQTVDGGKTWTSPQPVPELDWIKEDDGLIASVCDVTPGWHAPTKKYLAIGIRVRYDSKGHQVRDRARRVEGAYAIYDPIGNRWTNWLTLQVGGELTNTFSIMPGCTQWLINEDGTILLPIYFAKTQDDNNENYSATVTHFKFDGQKLEFIEHGDIITHNIPRGMCEPSLAKYKNKYYLTLRNDEKGYVTWSEDGLHYKPIKPWLFDDGTELGSYNTQQHWAVHSDGLFLVYTRKGANNDHIIRHRAPLFIARVNADPDALCVVRSTEKVVFPERGATMGNFGVSAVSPEETWVTVGEGMFKNARQRGAQGCVLVGRIIWSKPNQQVIPLLNSFPRNQK